jgi:nicotinate phosphoribosyltransferase
VGTAERSVLRPADQRPRCAAFFSGDVDAMPEGTVFFPDEPILRITAPLPIAQLVENTADQHPACAKTVIASKAARMVLAAAGRTLIDFGLRRAHGAEAGMFAARAAYLAGFAGTATVLAEPAYGVPIFGTMAHAFIQAHESEEAAFLAFARARPQNLVLLIDTYDTETAARNRRPPGAAVGGGGGDDRRRAPSIPAILRRMRAPCAPSLMMAG